MSHKASDECKKAVVDIHDTRIIGGVIMEGVDHYLFECHYKALVFVANYNAKNEKYEDTFAEFGGLYNVFSQGSAIETEYPEGYL